METMASRAELERLLEDDVPYGDLTTEALGIGANRASAVAPDCRPSLATQGLSRRLPLMGIVHRSMVSLYINSASIRAARAAPSASTGRKFRDLRSSATIASAMVSGVLPANSMRRPAR
jgi:hypothetical protein